MCFHLFFSECLGIEENYLHSIAIHNIKTQPLLQVTVNLLVLGSNPAYACFFLSNEVLVHTILFFMQARIFMFNNLKMPKLKRFSASFHASQAKQRVQRYHQDPDKRQQERERHFLRNQSDSSRDSSVSRQTRRQCDAAAHHER